MYKPKKRYYLSNAEIWKWTLQKKKKNETAHPKSGR